MDWNTALYCGWLWSKLHRHFFFTSFSYLFLPTFRPFHILKSGYRSITSFITSHHCYRFSSSLCTFYPVTVRSRINNPGISILFFLSSILCAGLKTVAFSTPLASLFAFLLHKTEHSHRKQFVTVHNVLNKACLVYLDLKHLPLEKRLHSTYIAKCC